MIARFARFIFLPIGRTWPSWFSKLAVIAGMKPGLGPRGRPKVRPRGGLVTASDHACFFFEPDPSLFRHTGGETFGMAGLALAQD